MPAGPRHILGDDSCWGPLDLHSALNGQSFPRLLAESLYSKTESHMGREA